MSADDMCTQIADLLSGHSALLEEFQIHIGSKYSSVSLRAREILAIGSQESEKHQVTICRDVVNRTLIV